MIDDNTAAVMADADYESLPQSSSVTTHMLAGAAAGIMEHCVMYPVDCVKVGILQTTLSMKSPNLPPSIRPTLGAIA